jgi:hypothetical protein
LNRRAALALVAALGVAACEHTATISTVSGAKLADIGQRQAGSYLAVVQTGGWNMSVSSTGISCGAHSFNADMNGPWAGQTTDALMAGLEKVRFTASMPKPAELMSGGYSAGIVLTQLSAATRFDATGGTAVVTTDLEAILIVTWPDGRRQQQIIAAHETRAGSAGFACGKIGDRVSESTSYALQSLIQKAVVTIKLLLAQSKTA